MKEVIRNNSDKHKNILKRLHILLENQQKPNNDLTIFPDAKLRVESENVDLISYINIINTLKCYNIHVEDDLYSLYFKLKSIKYRLKVTYHNDIAINLAVWTNNHIYIFLDMENFRLFIQSKLN